MKERYNKDTLKHQQEDLDKINLITLINIINCDWSESHSSIKRQMSNYNDKRVREEIAKKKEEKKKRPLEAYWDFDLRHHMYYWKNYDKIDLTTLKRLQIVIVVDDTWRTTRFFLGRV